jgi:DNA repair protein RecN (Recombination protein N)
MLQKLVIKNIALIDCAEISFTNGLNVLSGETGAGKSVIIESLNFVLGAKADKTLIRTGTAECFVQAVFDVSDNSSITNVLNELDIDEDDILIISRKFTIDGKSSIKVNGQSVAVSMLKKLTSRLVDVHGQSEHFYLLKSSNQLNLIDKFGGEELAQIKTKLQQEYSKLKGVLSRLNEFGGDEKDRLVKLDLLKYQVNEIESCNLIDGEENELISIKQKLANQEKIITALSTLKQVISAENGASDVLFSAIKSIDSISHFSASYSELSDRVDSTLSELSDIADTASSLLEDFDACDYDINAIENRLDTIKSLKKKYGQTYQEIIDYLESSKAEIDKLENFADLVSDLLVQKSEIEKVLYNSYQELTFARREICDKLCQNVLVELKELGMPKANFNVQFNNPIAFDDCAFNSANGLDVIEFQFSANNGEPLKPLSAVISGGEMSRFMLSLKAQTAKHDDISTFIFDEIDAGISGNTAKVVAEKFAKISKNTQIIAISHLPQISSMADNNLLIIKTENSDKTTTIVKKLTE